jgi:DNA-binding transcriptional LysR family regulator
MTLLTAPPPDVYRRRALSALEASGHPYRIGFTSPSLAGLHAALRAGLGVSVLPRDMLPPDMVVLGPEWGLPQLPDAEIALIRAKAALPQAAALLGDYVLSALDRARSTRPGHVSAGL